MADEKACGAIVFTYENGVRKYVIIRGYGIYQGYCGFPKGHVEAGETECETAIREIKEETGLDVVPFDDFRTVDEHTLAREGRPNDKKMNVYFLAEYHDQELVAQKSEVSEIALMTYEEALDSFQYEESKRELMEAESYLRKSWKIETERLIVRLFREDDGEALYRIKTDPQVLEFCPDFLDVDVKQEDILKYIQAFRKYEEDGDTDTWRCYAIENRETGEVMGAITFSKHNMLHEYELGWMMIGEYNGKGYASEAAEAFSESFCRKHGVDYLIAVMDIDNPASRRTAEKSGFRFFEKRTVYDYHYNRYADDYFYFRRYWTGCPLKDRFYGDSPYYGRSTSDRQE